MKRIIFLMLIVTSIAAFSAAQTAETESFRQEGIASWYGGEFAGRPTASGEIFDPSLFTAAHPTLPFGTVLTVTNTQNMHQVTVRINDRGPFVAARIIDLSRAAAEVLDMLATGTAPVIVEMAVNTALGPAAEAPQEVNTPLAAPLPNEIPVIDAPPVYAQTEQTMFPAPAAEIKGGIPPAGSMKLYRLQVGSYKIPRNAVDAFDKLKNLGLNPAYEQNGEFYRVVLAGLKAGEIQSIAQTLGNAGFREALIREETGY